MGTSISDFLEKEEPKKVVRSSDSDREWLDGVLGTDSKRKTNAVANFSDSTPKKSQRVLSIQQKTGLDHGIIERNLDDLEARIWKQDFEGAKHQPRVTDWLAQNPHHLPAATNDLPKLNFLERQVQNVGKQFQEGMRGFRTQVLGAREFFGTITPKESEELEGLLAQKRDDEDTDKEIRRGLTGAMLSALPGGATFGPAAAGFVADIPGAVANQIPVQAQLAGGALKGATAGAVVGGTVAAVTGQPELAPLLMARGAGWGARLGVAVQSFNLEAFSSYPTYRRMKDENGNPLSETTARIAASVKGLANAALEMAELNQLSKFVPGLKSLRPSAVDQALRVPSVRRALTEAVTSVPKAAFWEGGTEAVQQAVETTVGEIATMVQDGSINRLSTGEILQRIASHAPEWGQAAVQGAQAGAGFAGFAHIASLPSQAIQARQAQKNADFFRAIGSTVEQSELAKNLPEKMQEVVERITENGPVENVHAPLETWNDYWQSQNLDPDEVAREVTGSDEAYDQATMAGHDLVIPTARYATRIAGTRHNEFFANELRLSPESMNAREAQEVVQKLGEETEQPTEDSAVQVASQVQQQLEKAGFDPTTAETYSKLYESTFRNLGARTGVDPLELFNRFGLTIERAEAPNETLIQKAKKFLGLAKESRTPSGSRRNVSLVSDNGLLDELLNLESKQLAAEQRAQYNFVAIEKGSIGADVTVPLADRRGGQVSRQAKALQNIQQFAAIREQVVNELKVRGMTEEQINQALQNRRESREMTALEREESLSEEDIANLPEWAVDEVSFDPSEFDQSAYHGSPYVFQRFSLQKIGTGEGAQAYGWGLYFAGKKEVAEYYRRLLSGQHTAPAYDLFGYARELYEFRNGKHYRGGVEVSKRDYDAAHQSAVEQYENQPKRGVLYHVEIPEDATMLLWDRPLSEQPEGVELALRKAGFTADEVVNWSGAAAYQRLTQQVGNAEQASRLLAAKGVNGIRYVDAGSRGSVDGHSYNYVIFDDKLVEIRDYEQRRQNDNDPRGRIRIGRASIKIQLFKNADLSTFLHETGHFYTEVLSQLAPDNESVRNDLNLLREWTGATEEGFTREQNEQIARGFEAYLMEGKAPSEELRSVFSRFRAWLITVYRSLRSLDVELTPEVRGVFDRLLASQDAIDAASQNIAPLFPDPQAVGMTEQQAAEYQAQHEEARREAEEHVMAKMIADVTREQKRQWKEAREGVRAEVAAEVNEEPAYRALSILQKGVMPDGTELPEALQNLKLDRAALVQHFGGREIELRRLPFGIYRREGGIHPEVAAELLGFDSADALLNALPARGTENAKMRIERLTDERMKEKFGDLLTDGTLPEEAMKAVHNDKRAFVLRKELEFLRQGTFKNLVRKVTRRIPPIESVTAEAERIVSRQRNRDIRPGIYQIAEAKAGRNALNALLKGDIELAFDEKQRELFNHELYRAAIRIREENERTAQYLNRFNKKSVRERLGKAGGDYLAQIDALMERFDFRVSVSNKTLDRRQSLRDFLNREEHTELDVPEYLIDEANRKHYQEMTHEELIGLRDTVKQLDRFARLKNQLLANKRTRELETAAQESATAISDNARKTLPDEIETRLPTVERGRVLQGIFAAHRKFASLIRQMDGFIDGGVLFEHFLRPIDEAGNAEAVEQEKAHNELKKLFDLYTPTERRDFTTKRVIPGTTLSLSKQGRLAIALNWGNETNRERILTGYRRKGINEDTVQSILNSLDERDWQFVQGMWHYLNSYWPALEQLGKELWGVPPEKVEATPFTVQTSDGKTIEVKGGYYPIAYDRRQDTKAYTDPSKEIENAVRGGNIIRRSTKKGMLKERVEGVNRPVLLDLGVAFDHVNDVIHTLTHTRAVLDVRKLLEHEAVTDAIKRHYGDVIYGEMNRFVSDVTVGSLAPASAMERGLTWGRQGAVIAGLGLNLFTSLFQPIGLSNASARIGAKWVWRGINQWISVSPKRMQKVVEEVHEKSSFMRLRHKTLQREINEIRNTIGLEGGKLSGWIDDALSKVTNDKVTRDGIADGYFYFIGKAQMIADIPTWLGAYEKALAESNDDAKSVTLADRAVLDSQGGGQIKDLAGVQRGSQLLKLFTTFYSYFNVVYNQLAEAKARTDFKHPAEVARFAADVAFVMVIPIVLQRLFDNGLRGGDDDDALWEALGKDFAGYLASTMVGARELSGALLGYDYTGPAGLRLLSEATKLAQQISQGEADAALLRAINKTGGILFHYPAVQIDRTVRGIAALYAGDTDNPAALLFGPPRK